MIQHIDGIFVFESKLHGLGVFCAEDIHNGSLIDICPVIQLNKVDVQSILKTTLNNYYFEWGEALKKGAIALGYGSLYNHSYDANARYEIDIKFSTISIYACKDISAYKEITINYNGRPDDKTKVWFEQ